MYASEPLQTCEVRFFSGGARALRDRRRRVECDLGRGLLGRRICKFYGFGGSARRGVVREWSRRSKYALLQRAAAFGGEVRWQVVLTYHQNEQRREESKRALHRWLRWLRVNGGGAYLWVMEFQKRGAVHFHVFTECAPHGLSAAWLRAIGSVGDQAAGLYGVSVQAVGDMGAVRYALAYGRKKDQKTLPDGVESMGRWWGSSRGVKSQVISRDPRVVRVVARWFARRRFRGALQLFTTADERLRVFEGLCRLTVAYGGGVP